MAIYVFRMKMFVAVGVMPGTWGCGKTCGDVSLQRGRESTPDYFLGACRCLVENEGNRQASPKLKTLE